MANIYNFPGGVQTKELNVSRPQGVPDVVWGAVCSVRDMPRIPGVLYHEIPVSRELCDFGIGVEMMLADETDPDAGSQPSLAPSGWINMLYSRQPRYGWDSCWRCVAFLRVTLDNGEDDGLTPAMFWDETTTKITAAVPGTLNETVSISKDTAFSGVDSGSPAYGHRDVGCELRMSWTPQLDVSHTVDAECKADPDMSIDAGSQVVCLATLLQSAARGGADAHADR